MRVLYRVGFVGRASIAHRVFAAVTPLPRALVAACIIVLGLTGIRPAAAAAAAVSFTQYSTPNKDSCGTGNFALSMSGTTYFTNAWGCIYDAGILPAASKRLGRIDLDGKLDYLPVPAGLFPG
jgi:hypothetical protein